jgi:GLPGLI family protein
MKMTYFKTMLFLFFLFSTFNDKENKEVKIVCVTYKMVLPQEDQSDEAKTKLAQKNVSDDIKQTIRRAREIKYQIEFELYYNKNESLYKIVDALQINNDLASRIAKIQLGGNKIRYKNIFKKEKLYQIESSGEKFNVNLNFEEYIWDITSETKIINGYKCFKATSYKEEFDKIRNRKNSFYPVVWFTPEIPSSFGPEGLDGLPGLVLEGSTNGKTFMYATKVNFDYLGKLPIERPTKGKEVAEDEYLDIIARIFKSING